MKMTASECRHVIAPPNILMAVLGQLYTEKFA